MAFLAIQIPEYRWVIAIFKRFDPQLLRSRPDHVGMGKAIAARHADSGKITFHIGQKHRHTSLAELFRHGLQGHGFAGAGGARNQPVPVGLVQPQHLALTVGAKADEDVFHVCAAPALKGNRVSR